MELKMAFQKVCDFAHKAEVSVSLCCTKNTTLAKYLQEMRKCCKIVERILQDSLSISPILQDMSLHEFCKSCIDCMNFARFLQKLFFLSTRGWIDFQ